MRDKLNSTCLEGKLALVFGKSRLCDTFILSRFSHFFSLFIKNREIIYMKDGETITLAPQSTPRSDSPMMPAPQTLPTDPPTRS
jgi:hypothetical protein